jgi:hypothetical protein
MARNRFWFAVAPIIYAVRKKVHEKKGVSLRRYAHSTWRDTTPVTTYLVRGSGPQSLVTWRRRVSMDRMRVCEASYLRVGLDNSLSPRSMRLLCVCP